MLIYGELGGSGIKGQKGDIFVFSYFLSILCFHYYRDWVIFLATNRVNKKIILFENYDGICWCSAVSNGDFHW